MKMTHRVKRFSAGAVDLAIWESEVNVGGILVSKSHSIRGTRAAMAIGRTRTPSRGRSCRGWCENPCSHPIRWNPFPRVRLPRGAAGSDGLRQTGTNTHGDPPLPGTLIHADKLAGPGVPGPTRCESRPCSARLTRPNRCRSGGPRGCGGLWIGRTGMKDHR